MTLIRERQTGGSPQDFRVPTPEERFEELREVALRHHIPLAQIENLRSVIVVENTNRADSYQPINTTFIPSRSEGQPWSASVTPKGIQKGPGRYSRQR